MNKDSVIQALTHTDWPMLQGQKNELLNVLGRAVPPTDLLYGLISFIDAVQDAVVNDGLATEHQVFPPQIADHRGHTPTPWKVQNEDDIVGPGGNLVAECTGYSVKATGREQKRQGGREANAAFIVLACNKYAEEEDNG